MRVRFTDRFVATVKAAGSQQDFFDEVTPGLFLRVGAKRRSWGLLYTRAADGKRARVQFGTYPEKGLSEARARALELRSGLQDGEDAAVNVEAVRRQQVAAEERGITVGEVADLFIADRRSRGRRSVDEMERIVKVDVKPIIGKVEGGALRRADLVKVTNAKVAAGAKTQAIRVQQLLKAMTAWAVDNGHLDTDPGHRWKPVADKGESRERALSESEIRHLWHALENAGMSRWTIEALRLCLVTGQRQGEVGGMLRSEVDLERRLWTIPAARSKNGRAHVVPLSDPALAIIKPALEAHKLPAVFPGPRGKPMANTAVARAVLRSQEAIGLAHWTAHDLRRTVATQMASLGVGAFDIGAVLNHISTTRATVTTAVYVKHTFEAEKRKALDLWADRLAAIVGAGTATVVPLNPSRKTYGLGRKKAAA